MDKQISAGGILLNDKNELYLIHKISRDEWSLPKGKQEEGETLIETAKREIEEETGFKDIKLINNDEIGHDYYEFENPNNGKITAKHVYFFLFKIENENQTYTPEMKDEDLNGEWVDFAEALNKIQFENIKTVVLKAQEIVTSPN